MAPLPQRAHSAQDRPTAAVVIADPVVAENRWRELYDLTQAEARLALLLARGLSVRDAGERLGIRITTARTHHQRIIHKTDTRRQSELVALLLGGGLGRRALDARHDGVARWLGRGAIARHESPRTA